MPEKSARHIIIGTAGHVDHGKTTLIRALTGIDTDRLKEEKERGMTIDLGFASFKLPGGQEVGIVDVPGHERFLKNMLAGATGVDVVLLVIAADEGVMPQTREHLEILELLEARKGVVALTKSDMVDEDWLDLVEDEVRTALKQTFLKDAPIVRVSGATGAGMKELAEALSKLVEEAEQKSSSGPFRLPVDRVFTLTGFGTVVTGTLVSGTMRVGDPVRILPQGLESRIRQIQVHGHKEQEAQAGTRVAANLAGIEVSDLERGSVLVPPGYLVAAMRIDAFARMLPDAPKALKNRARIRLHIGTAEHIGRASIMGASEIPPGGEGYIQFVSETLLVAARGDRFVIRSYSPMRTVGGGTVLDPNPQRRRPSDRRAIETLETRRRGSPADLLEDLLLAAPGPVMLKDATGRTGLSEADTKAIVGGLSESGRVKWLEGSRIIHSAVFEALAARIAGTLEEYHRAHPLKAGMPREDLRAASASGLDQRAFGATLTEMERVGAVVASERTVRSQEHEPALSDEQKRLAEAVESGYRASGLNEPEGVEKSGEVFDFLVEAGRLVKIAEGLYLHRDTVERAEATLREHLKDGGRMTVSGFRDLMGSSRKYVVPLLEYFDTKRVTRRAGDERVLIGKP